MNADLQNWIVYSIVIIVIYLLFGSTVLSIWNLAINSFKLSDESKLDKNRARAPFSLDLFASACVDCKPTKISTKLSNPVKKSKQSIDSNGKI